MGAIMTWETDIVALALEGSDQADVLRIIRAATEEARTTGYDEGYDDGKDEAEEPDDAWLSDLETGLRLIDTDRTAAKVYLDRCTKQAGKHLIEVVPSCLL